MRRFKINNSYVRGFADADGHVSKSRLIIVFVNTNKNLLKRISKYLTELNIKHSFNAQQSKNKNHSTNYRINIYRQASVLRYSQKIGFCHPEKIKRLVNVLEKSHYVAWNLKIKKIFKLRKKGLSIAKIADSLKISPKTVWKYLQTDKTIIKKDHDK